eukprot:27303-Eustigmatos_ZCMA.PRE.1
MHSLSEGLGPRSTSSLVTVTVVGMPACSADTKILPLSTTPSKADAAKQHDGFSTLTMVRVALLAVAVGLLKLDSVS